MNRRLFLISLASSVGAFAAQRVLARAAAVANGRVLVDENSTSCRIPLNYCGLSYELSQLSDPEFFASSNKDLIAFFRLLSPAGVLRLGGNSSEFCYFLANASAKEPELRRPAWRSGENWMPHEQVAITPKAIDHLVGFLDAAGWQLIYGLNLGNGSPQRAAIEAQYVAEAMGSRLLYFQIGNEPNLYHNANNALRPPDWTMDDYVKQWTQFADAIIARVPEARFGGPDVAGDSPWIEPFAAATAGHLGSHFVAVTSHYYAEGPPDDPKMTIARLLRADSKVGERARANVEVAADLRIQYRMTEGNSCYRGGKPGVSDTFASALWAGDYMLCLAKDGCAGVNFHGGGRRYIRASLGGHMPGDALAKHPVAAGGSFYTPIAGDMADGFYARPIFYGIFLAGQFAGARVANCSLQTAGVNSTAYAGLIRDDLRIAVFNKSDSQDLRLKIETARSYKRSAVWRLASPELDAASDITLAGSAIDAHAHWLPKQVERLHDMTVDLPRSSAASILLKFNA